MSPAGLNCGMKDPESQLTDYVTSSRDFPQTSIVCVCATELHMTVWVFF